MSIAERENSRNIFTDFRRGLRKKTGAIILAGALATGGNAGLAAAASKNPDLSAPSPTTTEENLISANASDNQVRLKTNYSFDVNLDFDKSVISAVETVSITNNTQDPINELNFSVPSKATGEFSLGLVTVDGIDTAENWSNNSNLVVELPDPLEQNESTSVEINFQNNPTSNVNTYLNSALSKKDGIMQVSNWFPLLSNGHGMRMPGDSQFSESAENFHMKLKLDRPMQIAAPGEIKYNEDNIIVDFGPARNFGFSVSPNYIEKTGQVDGIKVQVLYKSGAAGDYALRVAKSALQTFNNKFIDYPYDKFVIAQGTRPKSGVEYPGITFIGSSFLRSANVIRHETAHQWFYGMLGNNQLTEPWLDEAFAQWAGNGFKGNNYCSEKPVDSSIYDFPNKYDYVTSSSCGSYNQTIYYKGANFIQGVRERMGDTSFFDSVNHLLTTRKFGLITTSLVAKTWIDFTPDKRKEAVRDYMRNYISW